MDGLDTESRSAVFGRCLLCAHGRGHEPYAEDPAAGEPLANNLWCRRNFTLLATDGEWTKVAPPGVIPKPQKRMEDAATDGIDITPINLGSPFGTILDVDSQSGPIVPVSKPKRRVDLQLSVPPGNGALVHRRGECRHVHVDGRCEVYWANDLRPDLDNRFDGTFPRRRRSGNIW